jgi:hypothetical protein
MVLASNNVKEAWAAVVAQCNLGRDHALLQRVFCRLTYGCVRWEGKKFLKRFRVNLKTSMESRFATTHRKVEAGTLVATVATTSTALRPGPDIDSRSGTSACAASHRFTQQEIDEIRECMELYTEDALVRGVEMGPIESELETDDERSRDRNEADDDHDHDGDDE